MSHRKAKPKNRPSLADPLKASSHPSYLHLTSFHPSKPLYAVATTAIGQNVVRIYDTDRPVHGALEARCEVRLKRGEEASCLAWTGGKGKKRKRVPSDGEFVCGLTNGRIYVVEQASGEIVRTLEGHTAAVTDWSVDQERGWSCSGDGLIKCWDPRTGSCLMTVSPELEAMPFTALAVSSTAFFAASSQTLFQISNPSGKVLSQVTPHTTPIHTIEYSSELDVVSTAAVDDRFIAIFSRKGDSLTRLGSLTCTHDVRAFKIHKDTLFAITVIGTLEVFQLFNTSFDSTKKGGLTKPPTAEIHLTTSHVANIEVQDVIPADKDVMISWIEGAKTGFETIEVVSLTGKVKINIQTRKEQSQQQLTSKPYDESKAVVFTGEEPPNAQLNGTAPKESDISFADRLSQIHPQPTEKKSITAVVLPNASSLSTVLTQALNSSDEKLLQTCFQQSHTSETIHNTLMRLSPVLIPSLLSYFNSLLSRKQKHVVGTLDWIKEVVIVHGGYLVSQGEEVRQVLLRLKGTLDRRGQNWERLVRLKGRLELLRTVKEREKVGKREPEVRWVEEEDAEEPEVEDVRYLTGGGDEEDGMEIEDVAGKEVQDATMVNGVESEDEDDDEEEEEELEEETGEVERVNGVPHFSDSEDSAMDLEDLIDDEASEASDDEDEESEEDIPPSPPKKKSKSRR